MTAKPKVGICFFNLKNQNSESIDVNIILQSLEKIPELVSIWDTNSKPPDSPESVLSEISEKNIDQIIVTGEKPGLIKSYFARLMNLAGKSPEKIITIDLNEYGASKKPETEKALAIITCAITGVSYDELVKSNNENINANTLVIGGGIAGIQASLEVAGSHNKVYLVEKTGTIGGHMAMFDKTFPTLDCAACILTPKMVDVGQHPFIELMTYCEVKSVSGLPGNYKVEIVQKARRVSIKTCTGCGICATKCPSSTKSEFDAGTSMRKAIYIPFPQAVPNKYLIDSEICRYVESGKCGVCVKVCPVENCIDLDEKDKVVELTVGNIIVATGFKTFDATRIERYGYGKYPNVVTSLELERLVNASGPTGGNICLRTQDKKGNWIFDSESPVPKSIAIIHCVGSRDENHHKYCSRVCCMYSLKLAHLVEEKIPDAKIYEHYIDMRAYGKGYEEFYKRIEGEGVNLIRGKIASVEETGTQLLVRSEDIENGRILEQKVDMVVLAVGLEPTEDATKLAGMLGIAQSDDGWLKEDKSLDDTTETSRGGIHLAGTCQGPKDIPDSVAQASAAASGVVKSILLKTTPVYLSSISLDSILSKTEDLTIVNEA